MKFSEVETNKQPRRSYDRNQLDFLEWGMLMRLSGFAVVVLSLIFVIPVQAREKEEVRIDQFDPPREVLGLMASSARYREAGTLYRVDLAEADTLLKWVIPAKSMVHFREDGVTPKYVFLSSNTRLDSLLVHGSGHNWMTTFHPNGRLKTVWLAEDIVIHGIPIRKATFWRAVRSRAATRFHDNGQLKLAWLSRDIEIQGHSFKKGDWVAFDEEGKVDFDPIID